MPRILLLIVLIACAASRAAEPALITAADLLKLKQLDAPALSPDGRRVVYAVKSIEPRAETPGEWDYRTHLWIAATDGSSPPRQLTFGAGADADPVWSPQGDRLAFTRAAERGRGQVYLLPLEGGEAAPLTKVETGASRPRWSPDGKRILFTSSLTPAQVRAALEKSGADAAPGWGTERPGRKPNDTKVQASRGRGAETPARKGGAGKGSGSRGSGGGATPTPTTATTGGSPEGNTLAGADGTLAERREWLARNEAAGDPRLLTRLNFLDERDLNPDLTFTHIFAQDADPAATAKDLTPGYVSYQGAEWTRDGAAIVASGPSRTDQHPDRVETSRLHRIDAAGGGVDLFLEMAGYSLASPLPSPDGAWVAFTATRGESFGYAPAVVGVAKAAGGTGAKLLTEALDRSAASLRWRPDGSEILFVTPANGGFPLQAVPVEGGAVRRLTPRTDTGVRGFDVSRETLVQVLTEPANPAELHAGDAKGAGAKPLTRHNAAWVSDRRLSAYEEHSLKNDRGMDVQFWTMRPTRTTPGKRHPLLLQIHGGPSAMWGPGEESMWFEFQYFAARGFALVFANPRGSGGYGEAFQRANHQDWGRGPAADVLAAADFAARQDFVDPARQVITGGSYGGYLTAWVIAHDQRFKAAVAQRGVYDLPTFFGEGNAWRLVPRAFGGLPWEPETRRILERESPLTHVAGIRTPLLIQHGDNDRRTGFVQSEMLFRSLKVLGRDAELVRYPRASHEMSRSGEPRHRLDSLVRYEEFFRRHVGEE